MLTLMFTMTYGIRIDRVDVAHWQFVDYYAPDRELKLKVRPGVAFFTVSEIIAAESTFIVMASHTARRSTRSKMI